MIQFKKEIELFAPVATHIRNTGFETQLSELQFYEYSIDLYAYSHKKRKTLAIELKLQKWKRAFEQALVYQLCSDLVYIALPVSSIMRVELDLLKQEGVGLIAVYFSGFCQTILESKPSKVLSKAYRKSNIQRLKEVAHV